MSIKFFNMYYNVTITLSSSHSA